MAKEHGLFMIGCVFPLPQFCHWQNAPRERGTGRGGPCSCLPMVGCFFAHGLPGLSACPARARGTGRGGPCPCLATLGVLLLSPNPAVCLPFPLHLLAVWHPPEAKGFTKPDRASAPVRRKRAARAYPLRRQDRRAETAVSRKRKPKASQSPTGRRRQCAGSEQRERIPCGGRAEGPDSL